MKVENLRVGRSLGIVFPGLFKKNTIVVDIQPSDTASSITIWLPFTKMTNILL